MPHQSRQLSQGETQVETSQETVWFKLKNTKRYKSRASTYIIKKSKTKSFKSPAKAQFTLTDRQKERETLSSSQQAGRWSLAKTQSHPATSQVEGLLTDGQSRKVMVWPSASAWCNKTHYHNYFNTCSHLSPQKGLSQSCQAILIDDLPWQSEQQKVGLNAFNFHPNNPIVSFFPFMHEKPACNLAT